MHDPKTTKVLIIAAASGRIRKLMDLVNRGANVNARDRAGNTAMMAAALYGQRDCIWALAAAGADTELRGDGWPHPTNPAWRLQRTALMWAAARGRAGCVQALIRSGADLRARDAEGQSAFLIAAANRHAECQKLLLQASASAIRSNLRYIAAEPRSATLRERTALHTLSPGMQPVPG